MKERELRERAQCAVCGRPFGHGNRIDFYTVSLDHYVVDAGAVGRQIGLEMMFNGNSAIAQAIGPDEDLAHRMATTEFTLCGECAMGSHCVPAIAERMSEPQETQPHE